jgi:Transglycosylase SLT domain
MITSEQSGRMRSLIERRPRALSEHPSDHSETRTIVIRQGSAWPSLAFLCLSLLLMAVVLLGHNTVRRLDQQHQQTSDTLAGVERKLQQLEAGMGFDSKRRHLLLGMRKHIMKVNPRVSLAEAYRYAELAIDASEKYPSVDPLLLLAIGVVESGYDPFAKSHADARGLYQIWPSTGRLLARSLGWSYDESTLYDPEKNTEAAALYLDMLFTTYSDPQMVLAEYNGGPLNAGYFRAGVTQLAAETKNYVPRVLELHARLKQEFATGMDVEPDATARDAAREGKALDPGRKVARSSPGPSPSRPGSAPAAAAPNVRAPEEPTSR